MADVYQVHDINPLFRLIGYGIMNFRGLKFPTELRGRENLEDLKDTGGVLLSEHKKGEDILALGRVQQEIGAGYGRFVMRDTLKWQWLLERAQGMPAKRVKDYVANNMDVETKKVIKAELDAHNAAISRAIGEASMRGEITTIFPQITRHEGLEAAVKGNFAPLLIAQRHVKSLGSDYKIRSAPARITYTPRDPLGDNPVTDVLVEVFKPEELSAIEAHDYWHECMNSPRMLSIGSKTLL